MERDRVMIYRKSDALETTTLLKDYKGWMNSCPAYHKLIKRDAKIRFEDCRWNKRINKALNRESRNWETCKYFRHEKLIYNPVQRYAWSKHYQRYWKNKEWKGIE